MTAIFKRRSPARTWIAALIGVAVLALVAAGCGSGSDSPRASSYGAPAPAAAASSADGAGQATVALASSKLGKVLVDDAGRTLYLFQADKGSTSTCDGACATAWPPVMTTGKPLAGPGVSASKLGTTRRDDGTSEVTYNGHPLYTFAGDGGPGQTAGQGVDGFGAEWYVVSAGGDAIETSG